ncbi:MAG: diguanylate cyclase [Vampirovibrionia bacterium]
MSIFVRVVDDEVGIIERNGRYLKTIFPGKIHLLVPAIDKLYKFNMKTTTYKLPMFSILLKKSYTVDIEATINYKITEPYKALYEVENKDLVYSFERLLIKTLSNEMRELSLEEAVSVIPDLNNAVKKALNSVARNWGFKLYSFEIKSIKKSFLAEQEKEKFYDIYKSERGTFMSEKVDSKDHSKVIHDDTKVSDYGNFVELTDMLEDHQPDLFDEKVEEKIEQLELNYDESSDEERQQLEIYKEHQREMLELHEKDIKKQQDDLMFQITEMSKKQDELLSMQKALLDRQNELDKKKMALGSSDLKQLEEDNLTLKDLAETDSLTGLNNRRYFIQEVGKFIDHSQCQTLAVYMIDVDNFKKVNDTYGHLAGDEALMLIASALKDTICEYDLLCRYGGEEFSIMSVVDTKEEASKYAEALRKSVENIEFNYDGTDIKLTISLGFTIKVPDDKNTIDTLLNSADKALYKAKDTGRNRCIYAKL